MSIMMSRLKRVMLPPWEGADTVEYWRAHKILYNLGGGKWLCRSIFVGKTNLGGRFWQRSGRHDPRQCATTSLKLGESNMNVA